MQAWTKLTLDVPGDLSDLVSGLLFDAGTSGIQVEDVPDRTRVRMSAYFRQDPERESSMVELRRAMGGLGSNGSRIADLGAVPVPEERWGEAWRESFQPERVSERFVVGPPWARPDAGENGIGIVIGPGMAFGTGRHESTRIALRALERRVKPESRVLDLGTGSGILGIAAAKLGARCLALDIDPVALENACDNRLANGVADRVHIVCGSLEAVSRTEFDVIVANIQSSVLIPLLSDFRERVRTKGCLILSGILEKEEEALGRALTKGPWASAEVLREGEWIGVVVERIA